MWLHNYLSMRAELSGEANDEGPKSSLECVVKWSSFSGIRKGILQFSSDRLKDLQTAYMRKFETLPDNILTRAMLVFGVAIGPIAPLPMLIIDFAVLSCMFLVFLGFWVAGGTISVILAGLAWIFGGNDAASSVFTNGTTVTEDFTFFILSILRIPAGLANLIGLIPSFVLELITESLNFGLVSVVYGAYNCRTSPSLPETEKQNTAQQNDYGTSAPVLEDPEKGLVKIEVVETKQATMLPKFTASEQANESVAGEIIAEIANESLKLNRA